MFINYQKKENVHIFTANPHYGEITFTLDDNLGGYAEVIFYGENEEVVRKRGKIEYKNSQPPSKWFQYLFIENVYRFRFFILQQAVSKIRKELDIQEISDEVIKEYAPEVKIMQDIVQIMKIKTDEEVLEKYYERRRNKDSNVGNPYNDESDIKIF